VWLNGLRKLAVAFRKARKAERRKAREQAKQKSSSSAASAKGEADEAEATEADDVLTTALSPSAARAFSQMYTEMDIPECLRAFGASGSANGFRFINEVLRSGRVRAVMADDDTVAMAADAMRGALTLEDLVLSAPPTTDDMLVYRGIGTRDALAGLEGNPAGIAVVEKGFLSTSASVVTAKNYGRVIEIFVPRGSRLLFLGSVVSRAYNDEDEVLFAPRASFVADALCTKEVTESTAFCTVKVRAQRVRFIGYADSAAAVGAVKSPRKV